MVYIHIGPAGWIDTAVERLLSLVVANILVIHVRIDIYNFGQLQTTTTQHLIDYCI